MARTVHLRNEPFADDGVVMLGQERTVWRQRSCAATRSLACRSGHPRSLGSGCQVGWADLSLADLRRVASELPDGWTFLAVPENPPGGQHLPIGDLSGADGEWCRYDRADHTPGPDAPMLAAATRFAVFDTQVQAVAEAGTSNRASNLWLSPATGTHATGGSCGPPRSGSPRSSRSRSDSGSTPPSVPAGEPGRRSTPYAGH